MTKKPRRTTAKQVLNRRHWSKVRYLRCIQSMLGHFDTDLQSLVKEAIFWQMDRNTTRFEGNLMVLERGNPSGMPLDHELKMCIYEATYRNAEAANWEQMHVKKVHS